MDHVFDPVYLEYLKSVAVGRVDSFKTISSDSWIYLTQLTKNTIIVASELWGNI